MSNKKIEKNDLVESEELLEEDLDQVAGGGMTSTAAPVGLQHNHTKGRGFARPGGSTTPGGGAGDPTGGASAEYGDVLE